MESTRTLLNKRAVTFETEGGTRLVFRGDSCTIVSGRTIPASEFLAVSRILGQMHELIHMPEKQNSRSR